MVGTTVTAEYHLMCATFVYYCYLFIYFYFHIYVNVVLVDIASANYIVTVHSIVVVVAIYYLTSVHTYFHLLGNYQSY